MFGTRFDFIDSDSIRRCSRLDLPMGHSHPLPGDGEQRKRCDRNLWSSTSVATVSSPFSR